MVHLHRERKRSKSPGKSSRKEAKAAARREREAEDARAVAELSMYTADDNPFNDANLGVQFKWVKKSEKEKKAGISAEEAQRRDTLRRAEAKVRSLSPRSLERCAERRKRVERR
jgi:hypothetical protein